MSEKVLYFTHCSETIFEDVYFLDSSESSDLWKLSFAKRLWTVNMLLVVDNSECSRFGVVEFTLANLTS